MRNKNIILESTGSNTKPVIGLNGEQFSSQKELCKHYGISPSSYSQMVKSGKSLKQYLSERNERNNHFVVDHNGKRFKSVAEMCRYHNIPVITYRQRVKKNWPLKDCLTTGTIRTVKQHKKFRTDPFTNEVYDTCADLCAHYGIEEKVFRGRLYDGWSSKEALTIPNGAKNNTRKRFVDHEGNKFKSIKEACAYWNISVWTYDQYKDKMTFGEIVNYIREKENNIPTTDHNGVKYKDFKTMCAAYGFRNPSCIRHRLETGMDLKTALTTPSQNDEIIIDPFGKQYASSADMCEDYNIDAKSFYTDKRNGYSLEECLNLIPKVNHRTTNLVIDEHLTVLKTIYSTSIRRGDYFTCYFNGAETIMTRKAIVNYQRKYILKNCNQ